MVEELYHSHKRLMFSRVHATAAAYPGADRSDLLSEAHAIFLRAVESWEPSSAKFTTHLYHQLRALSDEPRRIHRIRKHAPTVGLDELEAPVTAHRGAIRPLPPPEHEEPPEVSELAEDARVILAGILDGSFARKNGTRPCKRTAYAHLSDRGWSHSRLRRAWSELGDWVLAGGTPW